MADPASVTLTQLREAFATLGINLDDAFVRLDLAEDALRIQRVVRTPAGMTALRPEGGVQSKATVIGVVDQLPPPGG